METPLQSSDLCFPQFLQKLRQGRQAIILTDIEKQTKLPPLVEPPKL